MRDKHISYGGTREFTDIFLLPLEGWEIQGDTHLSLSFSHNDLDIRVPRIVRARVFLALLGEGQGKRHKQA